ncbi:MAG: polyprotein [Physalis torrado virus]|uniref:Polyprotein n=1 Tax=Physalis torrado virus TaxID=2885927 RepID=A0AAE8YCU5_9SECO|nr:MAG: polyprotein [Physalis torrado virus]
MSSRVGQKMIPSDNAREASEKLISQITAAVEEGNKNLLRKLGMGSYGILYAAQEKRAMDLFDPEDVTKISSLWSLFKRSLTESKDHANLFFHLYGVMFFMVPHVHSGEGAVKISLCSSNDPTDPVIQEKTLFFSGGAQAVLMSPEITLPFVKRGPMFYYTLECLNTRALIPCSVVAIWKQKISPRSAVYTAQETMSWAIEALNRPQFFSDRQEAAQYIASVYSSGERASQVLENRPFVGALLGNTHMNVPQESSLMRASSLRIPTLKIQSKRFPSMELPDFSRASSSTVGVREETGVDDDSNLLFPVKKAQAIDFGQVWDNYGVTDFNSFDFPDEWTTWHISRQIDFVLSTLLRQGRCHLPKHIERRDSHNINLEYIDEDNYLQVLKEYGITNVGSLERTCNWYSLTLRERVIELVHQRDHQYYRYGDVTNPMPRFDCYDGLTLMDRHKGGRAELDVAGALASLPQPRVKVAQEGGGSRSTTESKVLDSFATTTAMQSEGINKDQIVIEVADPEQEVSPDDVFFDFGEEMMEDAPIQLELQQPACVASKEFFHVGVFEFNWRKSANVAQELLALALPAALFSKKKETSMGSQMLKYYDAASLIFKVILYISGMGAVSGQLALVWDECNALNRTKEFVNIATVYASKHHLVSASEQSSGDFIFTPQGIGTFIPLDPAAGVPDLGSIRIFVTHPLASATELESIPCHVHLSCKVVSTNIMQPPRLRGQAHFGMLPGVTHFPRFPTNQVLLHYNWGTTAAMGTTLVSVFSPSGIYESDGTLQPSLLGNIARNCKWWRGTCVFEICVEKTLFHSGSLAIGLGTLATEMATAHDILNMPHVVCNLEVGRRFQFKCSLTNWNGCNLLSTGRKSSLPRPKHQAHMRLFATVMKPLVSTSVHLDTVGVTVQLKRIEDLQLGGSISVKPIYGHWTKGKSAVDFLFSEMNLTQRKELEKLRKENVEAYDDKGKKKDKEKVGQVALGLREKFSYGAVQYFCSAWKDTSRLVVLPCAPWSVRFSPTSPVKEAITCPFIDWCSSFCYWSGSLEYTLIIHRVQGSNNIGGVLNVALDTSGYPFSYGVAEGAHVLSAGGGSKWNFSYGVTTNIFSFVVQDDKFFPRRYTKAREFDSKSSRIVSLQDKLGLLLINLPPVDLISSIEIMVKPGPDFRLELAQPPLANHEKYLGDMQTHTYQYTSDFSELRDFSN